MTPGGPQARQREAARGSLSPERGREGGVREREEEVGACMAFDADGPKMDVVMGCRLMAVMASCGASERALETAEGGGFFAAWARHPVQGKLRLDGVALSAPEIKAPSAQCRQQPALSVGWCLSPLDGDPLVVPAGVGLYLTGPAFFCLRE
jgi:hypothetical protein